MSFSIKSMPVFFFCCILCELTIYAIFLLLFLFFSTLIFGHSYLKYLTPQHLKHLTSSIVLLLLILTFSFTSYFITLLNNTLNLFLEIGFLFSFLFLFLQFWARYPNLSQFQHFLLFFSFNSTFSLVKVCYWLSMLLMSKLL